MRSILFGLSIVMFGLPAFAQTIRPAPRPAPAQPESETVVLSSKSPTPRPANLMVGIEIKLALASARRGEWDLAASIAAAHSAAAADIIEWQRLRAGEAAFADYRAFLARNGDWPGLDLLRKRGETTIPENAPPADVIGFFEDQPPQTGTGAIRLATALEATGESAKANAALVGAWNTLPMSAEEEAAILARYQPVVSPHHAARLDMALWQKDIAAVTRMLPLVDEDRRALAEARLTLQRGGSGVDALIAAVPAGLAQDPGLAFDRMTWQISNQRRDRAADMIVERSVSAQSLGRPEEWANWRRILARGEMRAGNAQKAYELASAHRLEDGSDFADLEWLAGYIALRYLDRPSDALVHFRRFHAAVYTPISLGRAGYWEGRALEAMGNAEAAQAAYRDGARFQTSFYGLLAAEKAGVAMDPELTGAGPTVPWRGTTFSQSSLFSAAELFFKADQIWEASFFLGKLAELTPESELIALADFALGLGDPYLAVAAGKQIASEGVVAPRAYYPMPPLGSGTLPVRRELALSIARRESEFRADAVSGAGARGLMQLMPATAQSMAKKLGVSYTRARLTADPVYNAALGSAYLAQLIEEFGDNVVLVSVGYNAGPSRARAWITEYGDPRDPDVDVVDWIETIPFRETRNYVMRVAESIPVYRARLSGKIEPITLLSDLKKR